MSDVRMCEEGECVKAARHVFAVGLRCSDHIPVMTMRMPVIEAEEKVIQRKASGDCPECGAEVSLPPQVIGALIQKQTIAGGHCAKCGVGLTVQCGTVTTGILPRSDAALRRRFGIRL